MKKTLVFLLCLAAGLIASAQEKHEVVGFAFMGQEANTGCYVSGNGMYAAGDTVTLTLHLLNPNLQLIIWIDFLADNMLGSDTTLTFIMGNEPKQMVAMVTGGGNPQGHLLQMMSANTVENTSVGGDVIYNNEYPTEIRHSIIAPNTHVTLEAVPDEGFELLGWYSLQNDEEDYILVSRESTITFDMTGDTSVAAIFRPAGDTSLTLNVVASSEIPDTCSRGYILVNGTRTDNSFCHGQTGDSIHLVAVACPGYRFVDWSDGETSAERDYVLTEDFVKLVAHFVEDTTPVSIHPIDADGIRIYSSNGRVAVRGAEGSSVRVYDLAGRLVATVNNATAETLLTVPGKGLYLVRMDGKPARKVIVH